MRSPFLIAAVPLTLAVSLTACGRDKGDQAVQVKAESRDDLRPAQQMVVLPAETPIVVALQEPISSKTNRAGESFRVSLVVPIGVEGERALPAGSMLHGRIASIEPAGNGKPTRMRLTLTEAVLPSGQRETLRTRPLVLTGHASTETGLEKVAAGGVAGGIVGGIMGGKKGAALGAVLGAGAGTAVAVATKDNAIRLETGQRLEFRLEEPLRLPSVSA